MAPWYRPFISTTIIGRTHHLTPCATLQWINTVPFLPSTERTIRTSRGTCPAPEHFRTSRFLDGAQQLIGQPVELQLTAISCSSPTKALPMQRRMALFDSIALMAHSCVLPQARIFETLMLVRAVSSMRSATQSIFLIRLVYKRKAGSRFQPECLTPPASLSTRMVVSFSRWRLGLPADQRRLAGRRCAAGRFGTGRYRRG